MESCAGRLLVALPQLVDRNFSRTVVLILNHDDDGAFGLVLNRPTDMSVVTLLPGWDEVVAPPALIFNGGPVSLDSGFALAGLDALVPQPPSTRVQDMGHGLALVDFDEPPVATPNRQLRVFQGYSGWGAGQLDAEVGLGGWVVVDRMPDDPWAHPDGLWRRVLRRQPSPLRRLSFYPDDVSLN